MVRFRKHCPCRLTSQAGIGAANSEMVDFATEGESSG